MTEQKIIKMQYMYHNSCSSCCRRYADVSRQ